MREQAIGCNPYKTLEDDIHYEDVYACSKPSDDEPIYEEKEKPNQFFVSIS